MNTINYKEIEKFSKLSEEWWNPLGKFKPLHKLNPVRIKYIKQNIIEHFNIANLKNPLNNLSLLDVGCGGGLLSEPMCRLGAKVTGIDAIRKNIDIAKIHAKKNKLKINYVTVSPEKLKIKKKFDVILNMETVEHVSDLNYFIKSCANLLKKNVVFDFRSNDIINKGQGAPLAPIYHRMIIEKHVRNLALDFNEEPVHEPSNCRLVHTSGNFYNLLQFDGQHKTTAQIILERETVPMKIYSGATIDQINQLVKSYKIEHVRNMLKEKEIKNGLTLIALQWFFLEYYKD